MQGKSRWRTLPALLLAAFILAGCSVIPMGPFESTIPMTQGYGNGIGVFLVSVQTAGQGSNVYWLLSYTNRNDATNVSQVKLYSQNNGLGYPYEFAFNSSIKTNLNGKSLTACAVELGQANTGWDPARVKASRLRVSWPTTNDIIQDSFVSNLSNYYWSGSEIINDDLVTRTNAMVFIFFTNVTPVIGAGSNLTIRVIDSVIGEVYHDSW